MHHTPVAEPATTPLARFGSGRIVTTGTIVAVEVDDVRFPTSRMLDGSDAMHTDPDYSAAYVTLRTDDGGADGERDGYGFVFTIGRGNDVAAAAIRALAPQIVGMPVPDTPPALADLSRRLVGDSQLRWLGPEKGVDAHGDRRGGQRRVGPRQPAGRAAALAVPRLAHPRGDRRPGRLPLPHRRAHPRRCARDPARIRGRSRRAHRPTARARLPRLHHVGGLVGVRRRQARPALQRSRRRRIHADQVEGRRRHRGRRPTRAARP